MPEKGKLPNQNRPAVPAVGDAERKMQDAGRNEPWRSEGSAKRCLPATRLQLGGRSCAAPHPRVYPSGEGRDMSDHAPEVTKASVAPDAAQIL